MCDQPLEAQIDGYLKPLGQTTSSSTVASHRSTLRKFSIWKSRQERSDADCLGYTSIAAFAVKLQSEFAQETVKGHLDSIANFLGFISKDDPTLVKIQIASHLQRYGSILSQGYHPKLEEVLVPSQPTEESIEAANEVHQYLRHRQFGTRTHAIVETIVDTKVPPHLVPELRLNDFDPESGNLRVEIPEQHILRQSGLLHRRTASLSQSALEAINTYVRYDRPESHSDTARPLFTTSHGAISESTLRRSLRTANENSPKIHDEQALTPRAVWRAAVNELLDR